MSYTLSYDTYVNSSIFGTNGMPSVYVDKVYVSSESDPNRPDYGSFSTFKVSLYAYELSSPNETPLWYLDDNITQYLNIKVILWGEYGGNLIDLSTKLFSPIASTDLSQYSIGTLPDGNIIYKIPYEVTVDTSSDTQAGDDGTGEYTPLEDYNRIYITARFELDNDLILKDYNFEPDEVDSYVSTKQVSRSGNIVVNQTQYLTPDGELWMGAIHKHKKVIMAGRTHSLTENHPVLSSITTSNKVFVDNERQNIEMIVDFSMDNVLQNLLESKEQTIRSSYSNDLTEKATFSNQYLTRSKNLEGDHDNMCLFFSVDFQQIMVSNSKYGYFYSYLSDKIKTQLMNRCRVEFIRILRERLDANITSNELIASSKDSNNGNLQKTDNIVEQNLSGNRTTRTFQVFDNDVLVAEAGNYNYKCEIWVSDPIYDLFSDFYQNLSNIVEQLTSYYNETNISKNYDYLRDELRESYQDQISINYSNNAARVLQEFFETFQLTTAKVSDRIISSIKDYLKPETASLSSIEQSVEIFDVIRNNFQLLTNTSDPDVSNKVDPYGSSNESKNMIIVEHVFDSFDISDYLNYLQFMYGTSTNLEISENQFTGQYEGDISIFTSGDTTWNSYKVYKNSLYSFFSLKYLFMNDSLFETYDHDSEIFEEIMSLYNFGKSDSQSMSEGFTGYEAAQLLTQNGLSISVSGLSSEGQERQGKSMSSFLGNQSDAVNSGVGDLDFGTMFMAETLQELYKQFIVKVPVDEDEINISLAANEVDRISPENVDISPFQSRILQYASLGSSIPSTFNPSSLAYVVSLASSGANFTDSVFQSQLVKFLVYLKYGTMGRIEYLVDPLYSSGGVKDPNWSRLTQDVLNSRRTGKILCRIVRINPWNYPAKSSTIFDDFCIVNSYFILDLQS